MLAFIQQVFNLLTSNPGNLAYHLVLAFSIFGALQASIFYWNGRYAPTGRRTILGLGLMLIARLLLFLTAALAWKGFLDPHSLPPVDRVVGLFSLVIIIWLWAFPRPTRPADAAALLLSLLVLTFFALSSVWWNAQLPDVTYNASWPDQIGEGIALFLIILGGLMLVVRRPDGWGAGLGMLILLFLGHLAHILLPVMGSDYAGAVRLAELAAFPLLLALPQRFPISAAPQPSLETPHDTSEAHLYQTLLSLATESSSERICRDLTRSLAELFQADASLLVGPLENRDEVRILCGYSQEKGDSFPEAAVQDRLAPTLTDALVKGQSLRMASSNAAILDGFGQALGFPRIGPFLAAPLITSETGPAFSVVLLNPYSMRGWSSEDQAFLESISPILSRILERNQITTSLLDELSNAHLNLDNVRQKCEKIEHDNAELHSQMDAVRQQALQEHSRAESLAALVAGHEASQETIANLEAELQTLKAGTKKPSGASIFPAPQTEPVNSAVPDQTQAEIDRLKAYLEDSEKELPGISPAPAGGPISAGQAETVASISQELRQPMSSIVGYTDLLLSESVGILGAMQRKFLERIKASLERMSGLVDDLVQSAAIGNEATTSPAQKADLSEVIDEAIALIITQLREKSILLRVNIPEQLPAVNVDRDALQQMLIHLLQNAGSATPAEGEIYLHASLKDEDNLQDFILLQVSDTGGGISTEDLPKVFSRLYRADNSVIPGLGDSGIGLSIVKTLVEAQGGRIWVDTEMGKGSTFSVLLPISMSGAAQQASGQSPKEGSSS